MQGTAGSSARQGALFVALRARARGRAWLREVLAAALAALFFTEGAGAVFTDVTSAAGVSYAQHLPWAAPNCLLEGGAVCEADRMSGGAAAGDADGDGDLDLFVTRLDAPDILFCNRLVETGTPQFQDCSAAAGLDAFDLQSNGAAWGDIDNDGDLDLYVTTIGAGASDATNGRFYLFLNDGSGHFTEEAAPRGAAIPVAADRSGYTPTFGDYDRDGWLDLHVNEWYPTSRTTLLHNRGFSAPGFFDDVTAAAGLDPTQIPACQPPEGFCPVLAFGSTFADLDRDGWQDLAVVADFATSRIYWNDGDGTFTEGSTPACFDPDENGMGSTFGDLDGDGDLDWFVTSIHDPAQTCETQSCSWGYTGNRLHRNDGGRNFCDATDDVGVRAGYWGWGAVFFDYDNDGDLDLVMTNGVDFPDNPTDAAFNADPMRFWENDGTGAMSEVSAAVGVTDTRSGKGLLVFDYDDDGDLDLFVVNNASTPVLYRNEDGNANDWLRVRVEGSVSNRDGLGAVIEVTAVSGGPQQVREIGVASHFLGQSEPTAHFGLGPGPAAPVHEVRVTWPAFGQTTVYNDVPRNTTLSAVEPVIPTPSPPPSATPTPSPTATPTATATATSTPTATPTPTAGVPDIQLPRSLDFGAVAVGGTVTVDLSIDNVGSGSLRVTAIRSSDAAVFTPGTGTVTIASAGFLVLLMGSLRGRGWRGRVGALLAATVLVLFALSEPSGAGRRRATLDIQIPPGGSALLPIEFMPAQAVSYAETLMIASDDPDEPVVTVDLLGTGIGS